jgi:hypothetical protein
MSISTSISRFTSYYARHGFGASVRRAVLAVRRGLFSNRMVVFYCDLARRAPPPEDLPSSLKVERLRSYLELSPEDLHQVIHVWNPKLAHRNIKERFDQEASLWLIRSGGGLAGYAWTLQGRTMVPYYLPLAEDDVHLFDFYVFPKYRGRAVIHFLVVYILCRLSDDGAARVFGEVAEWNHASLSSYTTTPFRRLGRARMSRILGRTMACWDEDSRAEKKESVRLIRAMTRTVRRDRAKVSVDSLERPPAK